jgi:hypothetical protein
MNGSGQCWSELLSLRKRASLFLNSILRQHRLTNGADDIFRTTMMKMFVLQSLVRDPTLFQLTLLPYPGL